ncbi:hypothetical protein HYFRA_00001637 [Hymenoscyphus fraxineus]|uniref:Uncharacterized protein n=1 Tax=Hymenoscyphus fraxineus TaxID=746836 RepID=A0A9N9L723_9HELO|nr:hypothetical protein HYFRA_00001637 [Hymenoscyphus fraxineus]
MTLGVSRQQKNDDFSCKARRFEAQSPGSPTVRMNVPVISMGGFSAVVAVSRDLCPFHDKRSSRKYIGFASGAKVLVFVYFSALWFHRKALILDEARQDELNLPRPF